MLKVFWIRDSNKRCDVNSIEKFSKVAFNT